MSKILPVLFILFSLSIFAFFSPVKSFAFSWPFSIPQSSKPALPSTQPRPSIPVTPSLIPSKTPVPTKSQLAVVDKKTYIMNEINAYRISLHLSTVHTDTYSCDFAKVRAREIRTSFTHDGFETRAQAHTLPYPLWHSVTENIAQTPNYKEVVTLWINSPGHAANMRKDTPNVCVESNGNYYAYEGWKP